jgi:hypothetical protein
MKEQVGHYYDQHGFSFSPLLVAEGQLAYFEIHYQNRFRGRCVARIVLWSAEGPLPQDVPPVDTKVECDAGEFGILRVPYAIGRSWQGKKMLYHITCTARFPRGRGYRMSDSDGRSVGQVRSVVREVFQKLLGLVGGRTRIMPPATYRVVLPRDVESVIDPNRQVEKVIEYMWLDPAIFKFGHEGA